MAIENSTELSKRIADLKAKVAYTEALRKPDDLSNLMEIIEFLFSSAPLSQPTLTLVFARSITTSPQTITMPQSVDTLDYLISYSAYAAGGAWAISEPTIIDDLEFSIEFNTPCEVVFTIVVNP